MLEEISPELGVTDPVSGPVIVERIVAYKAESTEDDYDDPRVGHPSD